MISSPELPFRGKSRVALVERLLQRFDSVAKTHEPRLVLIEAESGWGKSRLLHELFKRLSLEQEAPRYWPSSILDAVPAVYGDELETPEGRRKRIRPEQFTRPAGSQPHYFWWGIGVRRGPDARIVDAALASLDDHREGLSKRWRTLAPRSKRYRDLLTSGAAREFGENAALTFLEHVPLVGLTPSLLRLTKDVIGRARPLSERELGAPSALQARAEAFADEIVRFAEVGIPIVIAIEDAHEADELLVDLLVRMLDAKAPILVLATAWPGEANRAKPYSRLSTDVPLARREHISSTDGDGKLEVEDLEAFVTELLGDAVSDVERRLIAERYPNIYLLEVACASAELRELVADRRVSRESLLRLPDEVVGFWNAQWQHLPPTIRDALMLAVLASPASVSDLFREAQSWDGTLPHRASEAMPWATSIASVLTAELDREGNARAWVRLIDEWMRTCHEPQKFEIAKRKALSRWLEDGPRGLEYWGQVAALIESDETSSLTAAQALSRNQLLVALASRGVVPWSDRAIEAAISLIDLYTAEGHAEGLTIVVTLGSLLSNLDPTWSLMGETSVGNALLQLGRVDEAATRFQALLDAERERLPAPDVLHLERALITARQAAGQFREAIEEQQRILEKLRRLLKWSTHPDVIAERLRLANLVENGGDYVAALALLEEISADCDADPSVEPIWRFRARRALAEALSICGRTQEALSMLELAVFDSADADDEELRLARWETALMRLDADSPWQLAANAPLLQAKPEPSADSPTWSPRAFELLLAEMLPALGPNHDLVRDVRHRRASALQFFEQFDGAVAILADLSREIGEEKGDRHPRSLKARLDVLEARALAATRNQREEPEMRNAYERIVEDCREWLGPTHPVTLDARSAHADHRMKTGETETLVWEFTELVAEWGKRLGASHSRTLNWRHHLVHLLENLGHWEAALDEGRLLLEGWKELQGSESPWLLHGRFHIAHAISKIEGPPAAIAALVTLILEQLDNLHSADHLVNTIGCLKALESVLQEASPSDVRAGTEHLRPLSQQLEAKRLLENSVFHGLSVTLAKAFETAEMFEEAVPLRRAFYEHFASRTGEQGVFAKLTLHSAHNLAHALVGAGKKQEALSTLAELVNLIKKLCVVQEDAELKRASIRVLESVAEDLEGGLLNVPDLAAEARSLLAAMQTGG